MSGATARLLGVVWVLVLGLVGLAFLGGSDAGDDALGPGVPSTASSSSVVSPVGALTAVAEGVVAVGGVVGAAPSTTIPAAPVTTSARAVTTVPPSTTTAPASTPTTSTTTVTVRSTQTTVDMGTVPVTVADPTPWAGPPCDPNYLSPCILSGLDPAPNCDDIGQLVIVASDGDDPYGLNRDGDGTGCDGFA